MAIKIIGDGWNVSSTASTQALAEIVYEIFANFVGYELDHDIVVDNNLVQGYPLAHFEKSNDNWQITLSCESGTYWAQVAYQLAHEICHLYCNHSQSRGHKHKWFEESFCECASIAVLEKLGLDWKQSKMSTFNPEFGQSVITYVDDVKNNTIKQIDNHKEFTDWLSDSIIQLESSSTLRDLNRVVALYMYTSILKESPSNWLAVTSLNKWDCFGDDGFDELIDSWLVASNDNSNEVACVSSLLKP